MAAARTDAPRLPAEWEPHASTWLAWPRNRWDWPGRFAAIPYVYAEIIRHLARRERVDLIVQDAAAALRVRRFLERAHALTGEVVLHPWPTDRVWTRDSGCTFVRAGAGLRGVAWAFNAWAKYPDFLKDREVGGRMAKAAGAAAVRPVHRGRRVVLEGGSIDGNGEGVLLTTEECLLGEVQQRNPGLDRAAYEAVLAEHLGVRQVLWLGRGIEGDDTHGHVDDITRFVGPATVLTAVQPDPRDPDHQPLRENLARLKAARTPEGRPFEVVELPMPSPVRFRGRRLPASYANFYIANGLVLAPVFNDPNDRHALDLLARLFPERQVVGIYAGDLVWGFGTLHCMTQQQPGQA